MGATLRQRDEFDQPSNTEQLYNWIGQMRSKKIKYLRSRRRNIRVEAVLGYALSQAEQELRNKQIARIHRWQQFKKQMEAMSDTSATFNYDDDDDILDQRQSYANDSCNNNNNNNVWGGTLCPELNSLDKFMSKLGEIKAPLQR